MEKDFDGWNEQKKRIQTERGVVYAHPREVWWCALGINIGAETDGKNEDFERPVLVLRVYNRETLLVMPITSKSKSDSFHCPVRVKFGTVWVKLTQARVVSSRRLLRKVDMLTEKEFQVAKEAFKEFI